MICFSSALARWSIFAIAASAAFLASCSTHTESAKPRTEEVSAASADLAACSNNGQEIPCNTDADCASPDMPCGVGQCTPTHSCQWCPRPGSFQCRGPEVGHDCDAPEYCDGSAFTCPAPTATVRPAGALCRAASNLCDQPETCNGSSSLCPDDLLRPTGYVCRSSLGICDVEETCDGAHAVCPTDRFGNAGVTCRASAGICDHEETCNGASPACPADSFKDPSVQCRPGGVPGTPDGVCNPAEYCSGRAAECPADSFAHSGTVCRSASDLCDSAETCSGSSPTCPADAPAPATTICRAAAGVCDTGESCDGVSKACPSDAHISAGTLCRPGNGPCDAPEACDGAHAACPSDALEPSGFMCRPSVGGCDIAETCNGSSNACPADTKQSAGFVCRAAVGPTAGADSSCDVAEICDGSSPYCPTDGFASNVTSCRNAVVDATHCNGTTYCTGASSACPSTIPPAPGGTQCGTGVGPCSTGGFCNGTTNTCPAVGTAPTGAACVAGCGMGMCSAAHACTNLTARASGTVCRAARQTRDADGTLHTCDVPESCDGASLACPADMFLAGGSTCRASGGICDTAEICTGSSPVCPADLRQPNSFACRAAVTGSDGSTCDIAEYCPGDLSTAACPTDRKMSAGSICRTDNLGGCDVAEACDGSSVVCPADHGVASGTVCHAANPTQLCDVAETCNGSSTPCAADAPAHAGAVCRASLGGCDPQELCDGTHFDCPADSRLASGTECRAAVGLCDRREVCSGLSAICPPDTIATAGTICRFPAGPCDVTESCTGASATCPADAFASTGTLCRGTAGPCDSPEFCGGSTSSCPSDAFISAGAGVVCRPAAGACDVADTCAGGSALCGSDARQPVGTVCRPADPTNACDLPELCGISVTCPSDAKSPDGTGCDTDGNPCNGVNQCQSGACQPPTTTVTNCDDNNDCTSDSCAAHLPDGGVGGCVHTPVANGTACNTSLYCVQGATCHAGICNGTPRNCGTPTDDCLVAVCDETTASCQTSANPSSTSHCSDSAIKPYIMLLLDNSGSMDSPTVAGASPPANSCGRERSRMSDAKCVITDVVSTYGEAVFGLGRYKVNCGGAYNPGTCPACHEGSSPANTCPVTCEPNSCACHSLDCSGCDTALGTGCPMGGASSDLGEVVSPVAEDNQPDLLRWVNYTQNGCGVSVSDPEIGVNPATFTPLAGVLNSAYRYYSGADPNYPSPVDSHNRCRPYYVVVLTDGDEDCTQFSNTISAANALHTVPVNEHGDGGPPRIVNVKTYVIGMGITGTTEETHVNDIATAGGTGHAYFATDEEGLSLAFTDILARSILVEECNGVDDNCNGLIDEGFTLYCDKQSGHFTQDMCTNAGDPCNGIDDNCYNGINDEIRNACGTCGTVTELSCNGLDDDCDGCVDGTKDPHTHLCPAVTGCACAETPETCDGIDNNCNGLVDENLQRNCGSSIGVCTVGSQICTAGVWSACSGNPPQMETCDGQDNDCDGVIDEIAQACGAYSNVGSCMSGEQICSAGTWGACTGGIGPAVEICDNIDNDCDTVIDNGNPGGGAVCNSLCGPGTVHCVAGQLLCTSSLGTGIAEICNGIDDNCDGIVDNLLPGADCGGVTCGSTCDGNGTLCLMGSWQCVAGAKECIGGGGVSAEVCDCHDNDCDGTVDDHLVDCPAGNSLGTACLPAPFCQCAHACNANAPEFPCPTGYRCSNATDPAHGFCVPDPCASIQCAPDSMGNFRFCRPNPTSGSGECVTVCAGVSCGAGQVCRPSDGMCVANTCDANPSECSSTEFCVNGSCAANLCAGVSCPAVQFCKAGNCTNSCANVHCNSGEKCTGGACVADRCAGVLCNAGRVCDPADGTCKTDMCTASIQCGRNSVCDPLTGQCVQNPCLGIDCPQGQICDQGECVIGYITTADGGRVEHRVLATGGGGFACSASSGKRGSPIPLGVLITVIVIGIVVRRRRSDGGGR